MKNPITNEQRSDQLCVALEGGSKYWYFLDDDATQAIAALVPKTHLPRPLSDRMWESILKGAIVPVRDYEDRTKVLGHISLKSIEKGEEIMSEKYTDHFADVIKESGDVTTGDIWFQLAVMGEVVFG